ncbi:MAG TPA: calcium-binding protein [Burkholderiales bacterium]|nr:calcium-binding protein [Burkholderiales bacterium]
MATFTFSALTDGQAISFDVSNDDLVFDQTGISAADLRFSTEGSNTRVSVLNGANAGKDIVLLDVSPLQLAQANVQFANGSVIRFGDNATTTNDDAGNSLVGGTGNDLVLGFGGNDFMQGGGGADSMLGGAGNDTMSGNDSTDRLDGGAGNDTVAGGGGQDTFVFSAFGAANADSVSDFASTWDRLAFDAGAFTEAGAVGRLSSGDDRFHAAAGASAGADAEDRFVYNTTTRQLFYDPDGNGAQAAQLIATLNAGASLTATDLWVEAAVEPPPPPPPSDPTAGNDSLNGTAGNDTIDGLAGNDTLDGLAGNDLLVGNDGSDLLLGGSGNDTLNGFSGSAAIPGGPESPRAPDTLDGGLGNDTFITGGEDHLLQDAGGIDTVIARDTDWTLGAGFENLIFQRADSDGGYNGTGNELNNVIDQSGYEHGGTLDGRGGNDSLIGAQHDTVLIGGDGNDTLQGAEVGSDTLLGGAGNDLLIGFEGLPGDSHDPDTLDGGAGNDTLTGDGTYVFSVAPGAANADLVTDFDTGTDTLQLDGLVHARTGLSGRFAAGDARFHSAPGANGGADATDRVVYNETTGQLWYDADGNGAAAAQLIATLQGAPTLSATDVEIVNGSPDEPEEPTEPQTINGTAGNDSLTGGAGNDTILGNGGNDLMSGSGGNDFMQGGNGADTIDGGAGNDVMSGNNDADRVGGGAGNDTVSGGGGQDAFFFNAFGAANADNVGDFASTWDRMIFDGGVFGEAGALGRFSAGDDRFFSGAGATGGADAEDRFVYNTTTRQLFYDADGSGGQSSQLVATLQAGASLTAMDVWIEAGTTPPPPPPDEINGTAGNDSIVGTFGNDTINGLGGNDTLDGSDGADRLDGGTGHDLLIGGRFDFEGVDGADTLIGGDGNDTLDGSSHGFGGTDPQAETLNGGLGDDWFYVDNPGDVLTDAGGLDTVVAHNMGWTLADGFENLEINNGQSESGVIGRGNALANVLDGGNDDGPGDGWHVQLEGLGGNDTLIGSVQNDTLLGGDGDDELDGGFDVDTLDGGAGNDRIHAGNDDGGNTLTGGSGADIFYFYSPIGGVTWNEVTDFASGADTLEFDGRLYAALGPTGRFAAGDGRFHAAAGATSGQDADDRLVYDTASGDLWYDEDGSGAQAGQLVARLGTGVALAATDIAVVNGSQSPSGETINGTSGHDSLAGGTGDDTLNGFAGNDTLRGNGGNDSLDGGSGTDLLDGGLGDDIYIVTAGDTLVDAGGTDTIHTPVNWTLATGFENVIMAGSGNVQVNGNNGANHITGNGGNNYFNARAGDDTLLGLDGNDVFDMSTGGTSSTGFDAIDGGAGTDTVDWAGYARSGVTVNLAAGTASGGGDGGVGGATLASIERVVGGGFADHFSGSAGAELLDGRQGNDTLAGGAGNDTLAGGTGNDFFVFAETGAANADAISDFASGADDIGLDNAVMAALGANGAFASGDDRFHAAAGAAGGADAEDRVVYNTSSGQLYYDADGSGGGAAQLIATLQPGAALAAGDISVI